MKRQETRKHQLPSCMHSNIHQGFCSPQTNPSLFGILTWLPDSTRIYIYIYWYCTIFAELFPKFFLEFRYEHHGKSSLSAWVGLESKKTHLGHVGEVLFRKTNLNVGGPIPWTSGVHWITKWRGGCQWTPPLPLCVWSAEDVRTRHTFPLQWIPPLQAKEKLLYIVSVSLLSQQWEPEQI